MLDNFQAGLRYIYGDIVNASNANRLGDNKGVSAALRSAMNHVSSIMLTDDDDPDEYDLICSWLKDQHQ